MGIQWRSAASLAVAAAALTAGCSIGDGGVANTAKGSAQGVEKSTPTAAPISATKEAVFTAQPVSDGPQAVTGRIAVRVWWGLQEQVPMQGMTVRASRISPCDPEKGYLPPTDAFIDKFTAVTDVQGRATFTGIPLGCYYVTADDNKDYQLASGSNGGVFLTSSQPNAEAGLEFERNTSRCDPASFNMTPYFNAAVVQYCDGQWALVNNDSPGDTARLLRWNETGWVSYAAFPTNDCRSKAVSDGVPSQYFSSFNKDC
ncbi:hypothetical protein [Smaragdicoccus niigatensis]|uniref:hypothetical protein n=1 Tax=Smaragdicoccus niigatensis TaxID=359359 RepID=UPI00037AD994|nr:hypothetical protein [Smaragdicoccus niigatensis]